MVQAFKRVSTGRFQYGSTRRAVPSKTRVYANKTDAMRELTKLSKHSEFGRGRKKRKPRARKDSDSDSDSDDDDLEFGKRRRRRSNGFGFGLDSLHGTVVSEISPSKSRRRGFVVCRSKNTGRFTAFKADTFKVGGRNKLAIVEKEKGGEGAVLYEFPENAKLFSISSNDMSRSTKKAKGDAMEIAKIYNDIEDSGSRIANDCYLKKNAVGAGDVGKIRGASSLGGDEYSTRPNKQVEDMLKRMKIAEKVTNKTVGLNARPQQVSEIALRLAEEDGYDFAGTGRDTYDKYVRQCDVNGQCRIVPKNNRSGGSRLGSGYGSSRFGSGYGSSRFGSRFGSGSGSGLSLGMRKPAYGFSNFLN